MDTLSSVTAGWIREYSSLPQLLCEGTEISPQYVGLSLVLTGKWRPLGIVHLTPNACAKCLSFLSFNRFGICIANSLQAERKRNGNYQWKIILFDPYFAFLMDAAKVSMPELQRISIMLFQCFAFGH